MPIYEYLCNSCGAKKEHIQKMSDAPIQSCPQCGGTDYAKQISAAVFMLKVSGWYVTDFRNKASQPAEKKDTQSNPADKPAETKTDSTVSTPSPATTTEKKTSTSSATPSE